MAEQRPGITHDQLLLFGCQPRRPPLKMFHLSVEQFLKGSPLSVFKDNPGHFLAVFVATEPGVLTETETGSDFKLKHQTSVFCAGTLKLCDERTIAAFF